MLLCSRLKKKTSDEVNRLIVQKKNEKMAPAFAAAPFAERVIFVPHCMRNIEKCRAKEMGSYYICAECNACKIGPISKRSKELGYRALYIVKGGRAIEQLINELSPKAIMGVACMFEGVLGMELGEKKKIKAVQFAPLTKDGCVNTDADLDKVFAVMEQSSPEK